MKTKKMEDVRSMMNRGCSIRYISENLNLKQSTVERYIRAINRERGKPVDVVNGSPKPRLKIDSPKILLFDIETIPMEVYVWALYKQTINVESIKKEWSIVSWSAKWLFEPKIYSFVASPQDAIERKDLEVVRGILDLFEQANICIGHNANRYDIRRLNARWIVNGFTPPSPYKVIDTLKISQKNFFFASHKLDYLTRLLCGSQKLKTEYNLWKRCSEGDAEALKYMEKYNRKDVRILEDFYVELIPWIKSHPTFGLYGNHNGSVCPNCGNNDLNFNIEPYYTPSGRYKAFRCMKCGAIGRSRFSDLSDEEKKSLLISTPN